jgi:hypothetical protein
MPNPPLTKLRLAPGRTPSARSPLARAARAWRTAGVTHRDTSLLLPSSRVAVPAGYHQSKNNGGSMTDSRAKVDNVYAFFYRRAALKASEGDDRQQLARGLSLASDIHYRETWRVFVEQILPCANLRNVQPTQLSKGNSVAVPEVNRQQLGSTQSKTNIKREREVERTTHGSVVSFLNYKEIYERRNAKHRAAAA